MGRNAEGQPGAADRGHVRRIEVFLSEMQVLRARIDGRAPIIIHDQLGLCAFGHRQCLADDGERSGIIEILRTQLNGADAELRQALDPRDSIDHGIKTIRIQHARTVSQRQGLKERQNRAHP